MKESSYKFRAGKMMDIEELLDFLDGIEYHLQRIQEDIDRIRLQLNK
jgi:hypothetical protein